MAISVSDFRARFPEFGDEIEYPSPRIQMFIDDTVDFIGDSESRWGGRYNLAQSYLAAHLLHTATLMEAGDANSRSGIATSKSAGGVSVTKNVQTKNYDELTEWFLTTAYGQRYVQILRMSFVGSLVARR